MSENQPASDAELNHLEQSLAAIKLTPSTSQREQLLYACGRAAGRSEANRRLRSVSAAALALACACSWLGYLVLTRPALPQPAGAAAPIVAQPALEPSQRRAAWSPAAGDSSSESQRLTPSIRFDELAEFDRRPAGGIQSVVDGVGDPPPQTVLTAGSRAWLDL